MAHNGKQYGPPNVPGLVGPYGQPVAMAAPYNLVPPASNYQAQQMMAHSVPLDMVRMNGCNGPNCGIGAAGGAMPPTMLPRGGVLSPPGMPYAPGVPAGPAVTSASFMQNPYGGSGVVNANMPAGMMAQGGIQLAQAGPGAAPTAQGVRFQSQRTQVRFTRPTGMKVSWFTQGPGGPMYSTTPIEAPGRYNFSQAAIYRLKLSNIEGRPGLEVYPTMEVVPCNPKTEAFLAHSAVPVEFTAEDFKQIADGNYVIKVIYLPDPQFQDLAGTGTDEILSTRLEPGADPIQEALRRGSILLVIRMGNVDQEAPNTPPLNAPGPNASAIPQMMMPPGGGGIPGGVGIPGTRMGIQVPYYGVPQTPPNAPSHPLLHGGNVQGSNMPSGATSPLSIPNVPSVPLSGNGLNLPKAPPVDAVNPGVPVVPTSKGSLDNSTAPAFPPPAPSTTPTTTPMPLPPPPTSSLPATMPTTSQLATGAGQSR